MKRKIFNLICLSLVVIFIFTGCISSPKADLTVKDFYDGSDFTIGNSSLTYDLTQTYVNTFNSDVESCSANVGKYSNQQMYDKLCDVNEKLYYIDTQASIAYAYYSLFQTESKWAQAYTFSSEAQVSAREEYYSLLKDLYDTSYRSTVFEGWTQDDINYVLSFSNEESALQIEYSNLLVEYNDLSEYDSNYMSKVETIYKKIVTNRQSLATAYGYDNYADYAYAEVYGREYTTAEVKSMIALVKEYVVPMYIKVIDKLEELEASSEFTQFYSEYYNMKNKQFFYLLDTIKPYFESYNKLGDYFNHFFENKSYILGFDETKTAGMAYTTYLSYYDTPVIFMGTDDSGYYQCASTFVHEMGHYASYVAASGADNLSYDIAEMQSQGNEWLYTYYLKDIMSEDAYSYYVYDTLADALQTIIISCAVEEFEQYVYSATSLKNVQLDTVMQNITKTYTGLSTMLNEIMPYYWRAVCLDNPEYYISYAMSMIPSIELYAVAVEQGFAKAKSLYQDVVCNYYDSNFTEFVSSLNMYTPFEADVYTYINDYCVGVYA